MPVRLTTLLMGAASLAACQSMPFSEPAPDIRLDAEEPLFEALYLGEEIIGEELAGAPESGFADPGTFVMPSELPPVPPREAPAASLKPHQAIEAANASSAIQPSTDNYVNAVQVYPYAEGALYQVYTAPEQVTDIALEPGEQLMSVSAGDTVRWVLGDTVSGIGETARVHILVKPVKSGLRTNLIITTSRRAYYLELTAYNETYMAAVSWRYPSETLVRRADASVGSGAAALPLQGLQLERLKFRYEIEGDAPHWRPERVFDDGSKVYIQFPARLDQGEAPPLFVVGRTGEAQLVNYRMRENFYVVDRLFARAELRMGEDRQDVVRIARTDLEGRGG